MEKQCTLLDLVYIVRRKVKLKEKRSDRQGQNIMLVCNLGDATY